MSIINTGTTSLGVNAMNLSKNSYNSATPLHPNPSNFYYLRHRSTGKTLSVSNVTTRMCKTGGVPDTTANIVLASDSDIINDQSNNLPSDATPYRVYIHTSKCFNIGGCTVNTSCRRLMRVFNKTLPYCSEFGSAKYASYDISPSVSDSRIVLRNPIELEGSPTSATNDETKCENAPLANLHGWNFVYSPTIFPGSDINRDGWKISALTNTSQYLTVNPSTSTAILTTTNDTSVIWDFIPVNINFNSCITLKNTLIANQTPFFAKTLSQCIPCNDEEVYRPPAPANPNHPITFTATNTQLVGSIPSASPLKVIDQTLTSTDTYTYLYIKVEKINTGESFTRFNAITSAIPSGNINLTIDLNNSSGSIKLGNYIITTLNVISNNIIPGTTYFNGATMGNISRGNMTSPVFTANDALMVTIWGNYFNDTSNDKFYARGTYTPPAITTTTQELTLKSDVNNPLNGVVCELPSSLTIPAGRRLYISIKTPSSNTPTRVATFSATLTAATNAFTFNFLNNAGNATFTFSNNSSIPLSDLRLLISGLPSNIAVSTSQQSFSLDRFGNASFSIEIYDAIYPSNPIARGSWNQVNTSIPAGIYTISSLNNEYGNFKFIGATANTVVERPVILNINPVGNSYRIAKINYEPLNIANNMSQWYIYSKFVAADGTLVSIGTDAKTPADTPINGQFVVALLKDSANVATTDTNGGLSLTTAVPTATINTAANIFAFNTWSYQNQALTITNDTATNSKCNIRLGATTKQGGWTYMAYPQSIQVKVDISGGESQTVNIPAVDTDTNIFTITYGASPVCTLGTKTATFSKPINITDTFTVTIYILDIAGSPITTSEGYFARGSIVGITPPAKADGQIIREEADNGTRVKFELPAGKALLADTLFMFTAISDNGSTAMQLPLDSNVANARTFTLEFYKGSGRDVAAFNINNKSYEVDSRSSTLNYYSSLTLYAYRPQFAASPTTEYDYKFTSNAIPEPSLTGSLAITASTASSTTLTGQTSASLPGRTNKFPRYMKLLLKAKNATRTREIPYNCTTDAPSFTISTLTPTSTDTTTQATIQFGTNPAVSLGEVLTSADIFELIIEDAISAPISGTTGYFQKYTYTPQSVLVFNQRSNADIAGSIIQSVTQTTGYRPIPRASTFEFAIQGTGTAATQTTTTKASVSLTEDVSTFKIAFSVGTGAQLVAGTQTVGLTGVTLYNYQTFTLTIKDSADVVFATGVSSSECRWDDCKAALEEARTKTYIAFDAATAPVCAGCFLTDSYDPCSASGDCETVQANATASHKKWSGSDFIQCHTCGTLKAKSNDPCQSALCAAAKSRAASAYQPYNASDLSDCNYCPEGTGGADSYDPCAPGGRCEQLIQEAKAADIKFTGSQFDECQACPAFQAMTNAPRPMINGTAEIAANGFAVKLTLPAATFFPLKANAFISIDGKSYDISGGYAITGTAPTEAYIQLPSMWAPTDIARLIIDGKTYDIKDVNRERVNRYTAFTFYIYQPSYDRTEYYAMFSYAGYTPTEQPIQLLSGADDTGVNFTLSSTPEFPQFPNSFSLHVYKNGVDIWNTVGKKFPGIDGIENEVPSLAPQKTFNVVSVKYGEPATLLLDNTSIPLTGQSITAYDDVKIELADIVYNPSRIPSAIIGRQRFVGSTAAVDEPNMSGSLGLTGSGVAGEVSPAAPATAKKFPMKMRIYVYAKDNSIRKTVDYTCKTVSEKFAISTTQAASTATPADSTITFEGQGNPAVSLGVALTTADTLALVIDDALTRPPTGSWPAVSQYFQSYSFTPPSFIEFTGRTTTAVRGLVKQTNSAATAGYRKIPVGGTVEVAVKGSGSGAAGARTLTATIPGTTPAAAEFTIGFTTGNEEARLKVGTADISLGGTLYQYQSFAVTIKNPDGSTFAAGVNATGCDYAACTAALEKLKAAKQPYNAADVSDCSACLQTEVYNPCETPGGECIMEQKRLTNIPKKWTGSEILACQACGSMRDSEYDPCKSASCAAAKAKAASEFTKYTASDFEECNYCPAGTGGADTYDPCSASGDCEMAQTASTNAKKKWVGSEFPQCQQCGSLKEREYDPCLSASCAAAKAKAASEFTKYTASDFAECDYCPSGTGGADIYDPCSASGDCETVQAALTASNREWSGSDIPQCQQCGSLKAKKFDPCKSEQCRDEQKRRTASYIPWDSTTMPECDYCTASDLVGSYDPCSASGPCERRQAELTALGIAWTGADLKECKYCSNLAGSWAPTASASETASASAPTASASVAPAAAAPAAPVGGGIFAVFQGATAPTPVAAAPRPAMPMKSIKPVPTYTPAVQERTVRIVVKEKPTAAAAAKAPVPRDYCVDSRKGFLANLVCEIREDVAGVSGKAKQLLGLF